MESNAIIRASSSDAWVLVTRPSPHGAQRARLHQASSTRPCSDPRRLAVLPSALLDSAVLPKWSAGYHLGMLAP